MRLERKPNPKAMQLYWSLLGRFLADGDGNRVVGAGLRDLNPDMQIRT